MKKTLRYNYRLNPTPEQEAKLIEFGATARGIWNRCCLKICVDMSTIRRSCFTKKWPRFLRN
ncbi:helix-turn-helix domain-containing protein [Pseudoalteromonas lipolytica]|uniref:helix-turn-helix domain-containing protein n=1 Tax=Pseudoalteromonas lipolytica TaxID=570156 RepID=UPI001FC95E3A|nr:helix-turn-helix domain-containing protein [Pseudoalteromonas donghaensis]